MRASLPEHLQITLLDPMDPLNRGSRLRSSLPEQPKITLLGSPNRDSRLRNSLQQHPRSLESGLPQPGLSGA